MGTCPLIFITTSHTMTLNYKEAGVDIEAGDAVVAAIKPAIKATRNPRVLSDIGLFGGFFDGRFPDLEWPILVASTDGVGTKLKIAFMMDRHDTVGQCLVNHCVNDILACGAKPLFFLDYVATGKLNPHVVAQVIIGMANACKENLTALLGGETAEMPTMYSDGEYDVAGTIVGVVDKNRIVDGRTIVSGDVMIGLPSTGLHTNGYSLARKALFPQYNVDSFMDELGTTLGDALLQVHRSYLLPVQSLLDNNIVKGLSHITGGGIVGNTKRIIPEGLTIRIDWSNWIVPPIFQLIQRAGSISDESMQEAFNLGVGMIAIVSADNVEVAMSLIESEHPFVVGQIQ